MMGREAKEISEQDLQRRRILLLRRQARRKSDRTEMKPLHCPDSLPSPAQASGRAPVRSLTSYKIIVSPRWPFVKDGQKGWQKGRPEKPALTAKQPAGFPGIRAAATPLQGPGAGHFHPCHQLVESLPQVLCVNLNEGSRDSQPACSYTPVYSSCRSNASKRSALLA